MALTPGTNAEPAGRGKRGGGRVNSHCFPSKQANKQTDKPVRNKSMKKLTLSRRVRPYYPFLFLAIYCYHTLPAFPRSISSSILSSPAENRGYGNHVFGDRYPCWTYRLLMLLSAGSHRWRKRAVGTEATPRKVPTSSSFAATARQPHLSHQMQSRACCVSILMSENGCRDSG